jgi:hypothetical protein
LFVFVLFRFLFLEESRWVFLKKTGATKKRIKQKKKKNGLRGP